MQFLKDQDEINAQFERLNSALQNTQLFADENYTETRTASSTEFMLMHVEDNDAIAFKHIVSRNYIWLNSDNTIDVPIGGAWQRGYFPSK